MLPFPQICGKEINNLSNGIGKMSLIHGKIKLKLDYFHAMLKIQSIKIKEYRKIQNCEMIVIKYKRIHFWDKVENQVLSVEPTSSCSYDGETDIKLT